VLIAGSLLTVLMLTNILNASIKENPFNDFKR
jgi:hypothetical protein